MPVLKPRTRVVFFRISEDEYCELSRLCATQGARSLSDMAREAIRGLLQPVDEVRAASGVTNRLEALERILSEVHETLKTLSAKADKAKAKETSK